MAEAGREEQRPDELWQRGDHDRRSRLVSATPGPPSLSHGTTFCRTDTLTELRESERVSRHQAALARSSGDSERDRRREREACPARPPPAPVTDPRVPLTQPPGAMCNSRLVHLLQVVTVLVLCLGVLAHSDAGNQVSTTLPTTGSNNLPRWRVL